MPTWRPAIWRPTPRRSIFGQSRTGKKKRRWSERRKFLISKQFSGVADGTRTHDNRNHNPGRFPGSMRPVAAFFLILRRNEPRRYAAPSQYIRKTYTVHPYSLYAMPPKLPAPLDANRLREIWKASAKDSAERELLLEIARLHRVQVDARILTDAIDKSRLETDGGKRVAIHRMRVLLDEGPGVVDWRAKVRVVSPCRSLAIH